MRRGNACVADTRITVSDVLGYRASGMSHEEILTDFPDLQSEHIEVVLRYAAQESLSISDQR